MKKIETRGRKQMYKEPSTQTKRYRIPKSKESEFNEYALKRIRQYIRDDKKTN
jgi:hypothetical protein